MTLDQTADTWGIWRLDLPHLGKKVYVTYFNSTNFLSIPYHNQILDPPLAQSNV